MISLPFSAIGSFCSGSCDLSHVYRLTLPRGTTLRRLCHHSSLLICRSRRFASLLYSVCPFSNGEGAFPRPPFESLIPLSIPHVFPNTLPQFCGGGTGVCMSPIPFHLRQSQYTRGYFHFWHIHSSQWDLVLVSACSNAN